MRVPVFPIVASLALLAAPAFAQNSSTTGNTGDQNGTPGYTSNGMTGNGGGYNGTGYNGTGYNGNGAYNGGAYNGTTGAYNNQTGNNQASGSSWANGANVTPNTRERIRQSLQQSGFRDVSVTPEAFVIHAMAPDGSHVVMLLRPDEVTGVIESGSSNGGSNGNYGNSGWNGGTNTNNGGNNNGGAANR